MSDPRATVPPMERQALRSGTPLGGIPVPRTAISEVLLEYVSPLFERLSLSARPEQLRTLLQLAVIIWNAMLDTSGEPEHKARRMIGAARPVSRRAPDGLRTHRGPAMSEGAARVFS